MQLMLQTIDSIWFDLLSIIKIADTPDRCFFNFNSVQLALVLEDYEPPALRVQGFVSRKKGARSIVEEKKEGEKKIIIMIIKKVK